jgi:hypothetical protein
MMLGPSWLWCEPTAMCSKLFIYIDFEFLALAKVIDAA